MIIAHDELFLHLLQCFQKNCTVKTYKQGLLQVRVNLSPESIDPCQPLPFAQGDMGQTFLLLVNFLYVQGPVYLMVQTVTSQNQHYGPIIIPFPNDKF